jgi:D-alanine-D-alanine ligase
MNLPLRIAVLLGGPSAEREVSLRSGAAVAAALRGLGHEIIEVDPVGNWALPGAIDVAFLALHGTYGEDGTVQSQLERIGVPYTGCGAAASRLAFDKVRTKERLLEAGVATPAFTVIDEAAAPWPEGWIPPVVLKPVRQGSSVGLQFVEEIDGWPEALAASLAHGAPVLVEERIHGPEVTVGILEGAALPLVEVRPREGGYNYHNKYTPGATEYLCPAPFERQVAESIQRAALRAFEAVGGRDYGRVDIMVRSGREPLVLEVNTLPGMTETSLLPKAAAAAGIEFGALCQRMVELALARRTGRVMEGSGVA